MCSTRPVHSCTRQVTELMGEWSLKKEGRRKRGREKGERKEGGRKERRAGRRKKGKKEGGSLPVSPTSTTDQFFFFKVIPYTDSKC